MLRSSGDRGGGQQGASRGSLFAPIGRSGERRLKIAREAGLEPWQSASREARPKPEQAARQYGSTRVRGVDSTAALEALARSSSSVSPNATLIGPCARVWSRGRLSSQSSCRQGGALRQVRRLFRVQRIAG